MLREKYFSSKERTECKEETITPYLLFSNLNPGLRKEHLSFIVQYVHVEQGAEI